MPSAESELSVIVIVGPTAVGKSELSINLAERLNGEIISADSRLFYRGMDIGTDKPPPEIRDRVHHHLIDVANPDETWSLAEFAAGARAAIQDIHSRGKLPFLVGGTGQYIRALVEGWHIPAVKPDHELRKDLERLAERIGYQALHERLLDLDPAAASRIDPRNLRRTIRALEVVYGSGIGISRQKRSDPPYTTKMIGLIRPRPEVYERIDRRIEKMIEGGLIEEVMSLLDQGYTCDLPSFSAIGYREVCAYLGAELSLEAAIEQMKKRSRQLVRRQANWFKPDDPKISWYPVDDGLIKILNQDILRFLFAEG